MKRLLLLALLALPAVAQTSGNDPIIERDVRISTRDGATVCATIVRPRTPEKLPALLNFTVYNWPDDVDALREAKRSASHGYAGVTALTRGKGCSPDAPLPYEHDGDDAADVIEWIAKQPWSDGRVGMFGGSYEGFTQWAAAKRVPKALKAMMPSVAAAPGIDIPMEGSIFQSFIYAWPFYTTNNKTLDDATYGDNARWMRVQHDWYVSGKPYRDLDKIDGTPNPFFDRWLAHPSYDAYWRAMIPYGAEFAKIDIPILATTGYYDGGMISTLYYFQQHHLRNPHAEHYLLTGPYNHISGQRGTKRLNGEWNDVLAGYHLDQAARIDMAELRYQWFDYVFRGAPKPALLQDVVNYEVMGANEWKHAPSLAAMSNRSLRVSLKSDQTQTIDLADRSDADRIAPGGGVLDKAIDTWNSVVFRSEPFAKATQLSGLFSGTLDFETNKKDVDISVALYEEMPDGQYFQLSYFMGRASYIRDRASRHLLTPNKRTRLPFTAGRLTSRMIGPGSRIVVILGPIRQLNMQIDYGTGKDVSDESMADAKTPLRIRWFGDSYIDLPLAQATP